MKNKNNKSFCYVRNKKKKREREKCFIIIICGDVIHYFFKCLFYVSMNYIIQIHIFYNI